MGLAEFWDATPRETLMFISAAMWRERGRYRRELWGSWHTAVLGKHDRPPSLEKILPDMEPRRKTHMTPQQEVAWWEALAAANSNQPMSEA